MKAMAFVGVMSLACFLATELAVSSAPSVQQRKNYYFELEVNHGSEAPHEIVEKTIAVLYQRLLALGVHGFNVERQGAKNSNKIRVELPATVDIERARRILSLVPQLEFRAVVSPVSPAPVKTYPSEAEARRAAVGRTQEVLPYPNYVAPGRPDQEPPSPVFIIAESPPLVTGKDIKAAQAVNHGSETDDYSIVFGLDAVGAKRLGEWTGKHINSYIAVVYNGKTITVAYIKSQITDNGQIDGRFTRTGAEDLALMLNVGGFPAPIKIISEGTYLRRIA